MPRGSRRSEAPAPAALLKTPTRRTKASEPKTPLVRVRRIHRRDLNATWEFLKLVFREVNRETVEYQRPHSKQRFLDIYDDEGVEQLLFELDEPGDGPKLVGYAECAYEPSGSDSWINERYFEAREMRPLFVDELAVHPEMQGRGVGNYMLAQCEHLAKLRGCTHLVLEVAENNSHALRFYRARNFQKLDAAVFLAKRLATEAELLPPRAIKPAPPAEETPPSKRSPAAPEPKRRVSKRARANEGASDDE